MKSGKNLVTASILHLVSDPWLFKSMKYYAYIQLIVVPLFILTTSNCGSALPSGKGAHGEGEQGDPGGAVVGEEDTHCTGKQAVVVDNKVCHAGGDTAAGEGEGRNGPPRFNTEADDDDCKYHVQFTVTPVFRDDDVTFTLTPTRLADRASVTGANLRVDAFLDAGHPAVTSRVRYKETSPGVYSIGPLRFDAPGRWTVRFHLFPRCNDTVTSPHGHVAFWIDVP